MPVISLSYGSKSFPLSFDSTRFTVLVPPESEAVAEQRFLIDSPPLPDLCRGRRVLLIVSDRTRPTGSLQFLPPLLSELSDARQVALLFATGLHRPLHDSDKIAIVGEDIFKAHPMLDHWPEGDNRFTGETSRGNKVEIDFQVLEYDLIVLTGAIGFHYFAGFAGGRKSLLPGVASQRSIQFNHLLVLNQDGPGRNPNVSVARLDGNPVHEDMLEAARLLDKPLFLFNTILDRNKQIAKIYSGHWENTHRAACKDYAASHTVTIKNRRPLAIVSAGGFPRDINMIQAHKAYEFAQHTVEPGGTIILLAECREGMGHATFYPWFQYQDLDEFEKHLRANYQVYGQTAYSLLSKARRFRLILVSALDRAVVETMGLIPAASLEEALALAGNEEGYIIPAGADVLASVNDN